jgi:hypothetical protein
MLSPKAPRSSPLDVRGVKTKVTTKQIVQAVRQVRHRKPAPRKHQRY